MPLISPTLPSDGTTATASSVDTVLNAILNVINGNIDSNNLAAGAVTTPALGANSVVYAALLSTIFSGQIVSYANTGTAGGYIYYLNMGGFKVYFGYSGNTVTCAGNTGTSVTWVTKSETANIVAGSAAGTPTGNSFVTSSVDRGNPTITQIILNLSAAGSGASVAGYAGFWFMAIGY